MLVAMPLSAIADYFLHGDALPWQAALPSLPELEHALRVQFVLTPVFLAAGDWMWLGGCRLSYPHPGPTS